MPRPDDQNGSTGSYLHRWLKFRKHRITIVNPTIRSEIKSMKRTTEYDINGYGFHAHKGNKFG